MFALAVVSARPRPAAADASLPPGDSRSGVDSRSDVDAWPGVEDPRTLRAQLLDWFAQYANPGTRRTYAYALGVPLTWIEPARSDLPTVSSGGSSAPVVSADDPPRRSTPPPAAPGPLHDLAWLRWCARRALDPRLATSTHVKAWVHALDAAGAGRRTRQRMLATVAALYAHLAETGAVPANPAAVNRTRLGLAGHREASPTVRLTAEQVRALLVAAGTLTHSRNPELTRLYATRAVAVLTLLTLGLRISELTGLNRADRLLTGGQDVLRVRGKGGHTREVFLPAPAGAALDVYLVERDRHTGTALPAHRGRTAATDTPMISTRGGGRCARADLNTLLRRVADAAGPELDGVRDRVHPHALRHAYVTIALERGAPIQHVQTDVGHASIATTRHYDRGLRTRDASAADLVAAALSAEPDPADDPA